MSPDGRRLTCVDCDFTDHVSAFDRAGMDRRCPDCGGGTALADSQPWDNTEGDADA